MRERSVYSSSLQHRLEAETTHEREERLQQLSDNQQRKLDTETTALRSRSPLVWFPDPSVMRMRITEGSGNQTSSPHNA